MLKDENGRAVLYCDHERCATRLDVGIYMAFVQRRRMPTGWLQTEINRHQCPMHPLPRVV